MRPKGGIWLVLALVLLALVYVRALAFTPTEASQGLAQKIFYLHAPSAWASFMAFIAVTVCSLGYLLLRDPRLDLFAAASAEVGVVFAVGVLISGSTWGRTIWGAWWTWDARLTSFFFLTFIFFGYLVLRSAIREAGQRARYSAVLGILGAPLVGFIHVSVKLFRTLHPQPVVLKPEGPSLPPEQLITLIGSFITFTLLYVAFVTRRYALARLEDERDRKLSEADHAAQ